MLAAQSFEMVEHKLFYIEIHHLAKPASVFLRFIPNTGWVITQTVFFSYFHFVFYDDHIVREMVKLTYEFDSQQMKGTSIFSDAGYLFPLSFMISLLFHSSQLTLNS